MINTKGLTSPNSDNRELTAEERYQAAYVVATAPMVAFKSGTEQITNALEAAFPGVEITDEMHDAAYAATVAVRADGGDGELALRAALDAAAAHLPAGV